MIFMFLKLSDKVYSFSAPNNSLEVFHTTMLTSVLQESQDWCIVVNLTLEVGEIW